ncbi:exported hypothetical protein [Candidatus Terasakiella magnetica]|nr:exported hypothetical protein [Candidatus Terasakiella magnetica]
MRLLRLFFTLLCLPVLSAAAWADCPDDPGLAVTYDSFQDRVVISDGAITHTRTKYEFATVTSSIPTGKTVSVRRGELGPQDCRDLWARIEASGFLHLEKSRYGAPEGLRHYLSSLKVVRGDTSKSVLFARNPSFEPAPEAFDAVSRHVLDLARSRAVDE